MKHTDNISVIDIGSNTIRLLIGNFKNGQINRLYSDRVVTRLGKDLNITKKLNSESINKSIEVINKFKLLSQNYNANILISIGTSALREAEDSLIFLKEVSEITGLKIRILTGEEEAFYTLEGIKLGLPQYKNFIAIDIGGGSTEWIFEEKDKIFQGSLNIGALRLKNISNYIDENNLRHHIKKIIESNLPQKKFNLLIATGGTATTFGMISLKIDNFMPDLIHGKKFSKNKLKQIVEKILKTNYEERKNIKGIPSDRLDIIIPGLLILESLVEYFNCNFFIISDFGLIEGIMKNYENFCYNV